MALSLGTNSGFVSVAPTADPAETAAGIDTRSGVTKDTSPAGAVKITQVGWWCDTATEETNFEVGLYAADGAVVPGEAGTRLYVSATNAKGTTAGWKAVTVDWNISGSTAYWIGVQVDDTVTATAIDRSSVDGSGFDTKLDTSLPDPYGGGALQDVDGMLAIYAVYAAADTSAFFLLF